MASDFSRTLALLRREKRISQRTAAGDLQVSQALLSHYENGLREPGLGFVVRAADYYGVSCDYLLGRSMSREGARAHQQTSSEGKEAQQDAFLKLLSDSTALLLELPSRILCKEDCKGLCSQCGANLNDHECSCQKDLIRKNPFSALASLLNEDEEV